jgi:hypothetical protein
VVDAEKEEEKHLTPQEPPRGERKFDHYEKDILGPIFNTNEPALKFGRIPTGGGFSLGPQYTRQGLFADHLTTNIYVAGSTRKWYGGAASLDFHDLANGHLELRADGGYQNSASVWYFGEGPDSSKSNSYFKSNTESWISTPNNRPCEFCPCQIGSRASLTIPRKCVSRPMEQSESPGATRPWQFDLSSLQREVKSI